MKKQFLIVIILVLLLSCKTNIDSHKNNSSSSSLSSYTTIPVLELPITVDLNIDTSPFSFDSVAEKQDIVNALKEISTESEPFVNLPDFSECSFSIVGKIKLSNNYLLVIKTNNCKLEYQSVCGVVLNTKNEILGQAVLANYSGGSQTGQKLISEISQDGMIQKTYNLSWSAEGEEVLIDSNLFIIEYKEKRGSFEFEYF